MALGKRRPQQQDLFLATADLPQSPGHPFYRKLNDLLGAVGFDPWAEQLCQPYYAEAVGRPSIPPGVYFRMILVGYFEGIASQRGIAWRCADSRSLAEFLGYGPTQATPDHSSLSRIHQRLPVEVHEEVFLFVLGIARKKGLLHGKTIAVDTTTLEANAAMKSITRTDSGEDWKQYLRRLAAEAGLEDPTDAELRRFDKQRKGKKVSNRDWQSPTDPDSRIAKMKDGTTHLAYRAEHAVDLGSEFVVGVQVLPAEGGEADTLVDAVLQAQVNLVRAGQEQEVEEVVADKGFHKAETLADCERLHTRTYIPEPERPGRRRWADKPAAHRKAFYANRRRVRGERSKRLQRLRSEYVERSFAHVCETGGARRCWLRGRETVTKRYLVQVAARNLGLLMRKLFGVGTARGLQGGPAGPWARWGRFLAAWRLVRAAVALIRPRVVHSSSLRLSSFGR